jgi:hypothetical protein
VNASDERPSAGSRRLMIGFAVAGVVIFGLVGGYAHVLWDASRTAKNEAGRVGELHEKLAVKAQPLTDAAFDEVLALCHTTDPEARFVALMSTTAHVQRHRPDLKSRVVPVADRLANDADPTVRQKASQCQLSLMPKPAP